jgi:hypothetical protein
MFLVTASPFFLRPAQAYTVTLEEIGSDVVATGSGAINLTGLTFFGSGVGLNPGILADFGTIIMGPGGAFVNVDVYFGFTGPRSFGSGDLFRPNTSSGDAFAFEAPIPFFHGEIIVPQGYVSGAALSDSMTFNNATFASLGVTPGSYVWRWGLERTRTSRFTSERLAFPMAAQQFLCLVSLWSAWLPSDAS